MQTQFFLNIYDSSDCSDSNDSSDSSEYWQKFTQPLREKNHATSKKQTKNMHYLLTYLPTYLSDNSDSSYSRDSADSSE